jgi:hypothetical protein
VQEIISTVLIVARTGLTLLNLDLETGRWVVEQMEEGGFLRSAAAVAAAVIVEMVVYQYQEVSLSSIMVLAVFQQQKELCVSLVMVVLEVVAEVLVMRLAILEEEEDIREVLQATPYLEMLVEVGRFWERQKVQVQ